MGEKVKVLVTGANGQLGRCLGDLAPEFPHIHLELYDKSSLDITSEAGVNQIFQGGNFDFCINTAAYTDVETAERQPEHAFAVNSTAVRNLARACGQYNVCLIHISTDYVFDGRKDGPYTTADKPNPINIYGESKLEGEKAIQELLHRYFIVRTSWLYSEHGNNFYKKILAKAKRGETIAVTDAQRGCPTNAHNLAEHVLKLVNDDRSDYGIQHFTDGEAMTWYEFAQRIVREHKFEGKVQVVRDNKSRSFASRPANSVLSGITSRE